MKTVAIVQARMGSTRLPGKVMQEIGGATMLARVVKRTQQSERVNQVIVATTDSPMDEAVVQECERLGVGVYRGDEDDVLDRYYRAAKEFGADAVVRITSDCPLIDAKVIDAVVDAFALNDCDYASNVQVRSFPRGLDSEVFSFGTLERAWERATEPYQRAHVTPFIYQHPEWFRLGSVTADADYSEHRWTVDTAQDLELVRAIYARLGNRDSFGWREALDVVEREPELRELNRMIQQKSLHEG